MKNSIFHFSKIPSFFHANLVFVRYSFPSFLSFSLTLLPPFSVQEHKFILNGDVRRIGTARNKVRHLVGDSYLSMSLCCPCGNTQAAPFRKKLRVSSPCNVVFKKESILVKVFDLQNQELLYFCKILYFVTNF